MTTITDFLDDRELLGSWFSGVSWNGWKAVLKAMYGQSMSPKEVKFFQNIAGGRDPPTRPVREAWFCCGRGAGKDSIASAIIAHAAAMFDQQNILRPGEKAMVACLAVDREQARIVLDYTRGYFAEGEFLHDLIETENAQGFDLTNGVRIAIFTNSYRAVRGPSMKICVLDEVAFWHSENSAKPDEETYRALRPGLARVPGSILVGISSPYRKSGLLYNKWKQFFGRNDPDVLVIQAPSRTLNPTINQAEIDRDMTDDPASARAEWLAEWRDDIAGWLEQELIDAAVDRNVTVRPPMRRYTYRSGCDPSGGAKDSFTLAIAHTDEGGVEVLDCVVEVKAPFNPTLATEQLAGVLREYKLQETATAMRLRGSSTPSPNAGSNIPIPNATGPQSIWMQCHCSSAAACGFWTTKNWSASSPRWSAGRVHSAETASTTAPTVTTMSLTPPPSPSSRDGSPPCASPRG
jgi:hypothetical protein